MDANKIEQLLTQVQAGQVNVAAAMEQLRRLPYEDLGHTRLDMHRALRQGLPEVVFAENKTPQQVVEILQRLWQNHDRVLATRVSPEKAEVVQTQIPAAHYDSTSRLLTLARQAFDPHPADAPYVMVVTGGTSDMPVAEEAAQTAEFLGSRVKRAFDVGVAGVHRLLDQRDALFDADVVISVAGMEGALTSVVGGLVACPVIGVPTSVGYGASFNGLAALLSMLNSCASGVAVVNIDNGFGAGLYAHMILRRLPKDKS